MPLFVDNAANITENGRTLLMSSTFMHGEEELVVEGEGGAYRRRMTWG